MANEMRDRHLVTDNPRSMTESMLNFAYAKNEKVYLRYANGTEDIDLCEYVSQLTKEQGCNFSADNVMQGSCIEGCDCEVAILYTLAVQAAELRERLKYYENLEDQGLLQTLPCKAGDIVLWNNGLEIQKKEVKGFSYINNDLGLRYVFDNFSPIINHEAIVGIVTKSEAEQKLKEMRGENDL